MATSDLAWEVIYHGVEDKGNVAAMKRLKKKKAGEMSTARREEEPLRHQTE